MWFIIFHATPLTRAMENTLHLMNSKNESYRKSLHRVDGSSEEAAQLELLTEQLQTFQGKLKYKKKHSQQMTEDLQVDHTFLLYFNPEFYKIIYY